MLIDRLQTGGPGQVNINTEKIYELGNYQSVGSVQDIPDLSFSMESFDVSAEMEAILVGGGFNIGTGAMTDADGTKYDLNASKPIDVVQAFKAGKTAAAPFSVVGSVALPYLVCESVSYRFGLRENASQTATLRGDQIIYVAGSMFVEQTVGTNAANQVIALPNNVFPNNDEGGTPRYALSVSLVSGKRLVRGVDYTEATTGVANAAGAFPVSVTIINAVPATDSIRIVYASDAASTHPQASHAAASATRPAAIRGRNIKVYVGGDGDPDDATRLVGVQSVNVDWRVNLDRDEEFGNPSIIGQDYDVPEVTGSVEVKPRDPLELINQIKRFSGVSLASAESVGALRRVPLPLRIDLTSPDTGVVLKTLFMPNARFSVPGFSGRVQTKQNVTFQFEEDGGVLEVYKGPKALVTP